MHYICALPSHEFLVTFLSSHMSWLEGLVTATTFLKEVGWSLSCPVYCGSSILLPLLLGLGLGFGLGLLFGLYIAWTFLIVVPPRPQSGPSRAFPKARSRLTGYLVDE